MTANTVTRRYTFKLYPTKEQDRALERQTVLLAQLWNAALEQRETQWRMEVQRKPRSERKGVSRFDQARELKFIRAENPDYEVMSGSSMELCLKALDEAFASFFSRAKSGAGRSSGYPQYKASKPVDKDWRSYHHDTIWHRNHRRGWRLYKNSGKNWRIYAKGIPGKLRARGKFPFELDEIEIRDMCIIRRDGNWCCSIVVKQPHRMKSGRAAVRTDFDLIDEFAVAKNTANGEYISGWEGKNSLSDEQISPENQVVVHSSGEVTEDLGAERRTDRQPVPAKRGEVTEDLGAERRLTCKPSSSSLGEVTEDLGAECKTPAHLPEPHQGEVTDDLGAECRWRGQFENTPNGEATKDLGGESRRSMLKHQASVAQATEDELRREQTTRFKKGSYRWRKMANRIARLKAKSARAKKHELHVRTTELVRNASSLEVICPDISKHTRSAKGNARNHGAAVRPIAALNRHVLAQAPGEAIQMLEYKAKEAGIPFTRQEPEEHQLAINHELPVATKTIRKARHQIRKGTS